MKPTFSASFRAFTLVLLKMHASAIQGLFKWLNRTNDALGELAKGFGNKVAAAVKAANAEIAKTNKLFAEMLGKKNTKTERENIVADAGLS